MSGQVWGGRYRAEDVLGRGGMATVWRGRDLRLDRPVAIKVLTVAGADDPTALDRFHREAQTVARLAHPHIVGVYDVGVDDDMPYFILELVPGGSVADLLARGPLPVARAVRIAAETCRALSAAHVAGVVHRDIKPANLLLAADGSVKVCDFGIARLQGKTQAGLTAPATAIGTSQYMAPEQAAGGPVDARTDLYALGCVLFTMLTGAPPFDGDNPLGVLYQHLNQPAPPVRSRRPDVPPALDTLVGRLLAKDPADRPASAEQTAQLLAAAEGASGATPGAGLAPTAVAPVPGAGLSPTAVAPVAFARASAPVPPARPMSGTRTMPAAEPWSPPSGAGRRSPALIAVLAALVVLLAVVGLFALQDRPARQQRGSGGAWTSAPGSTTEENPSPEETTPPLADNPIDAINAVLTQEVQAGRLDEGKAEELSKDLQELNEKLAEGGRGKALKKAAEFTHRLEELHREGEISDTAYRAILGSLRDLASGRASEAGTDQGDG